MLNYNNNPDYTAYHGAGLSAWVNLLQSKYDFVCHELFGINAFFVKKGLLNDGVIKGMNNLDSLYNEHPYLYNYVPYPRNYPILTSHEALAILKK